MTVRFSILVLTLTYFLSAQALRAQIHPLTGDPLAHTFSIVASDTITGEMAVGV